MAVIIDIADAVESLLNGRAFTPPFTAERLYLPRFELQEMETLHVSVVPAAFDQGLLDRVRVNEEYRIHVAVQQRWDGTDEHIELLLDLVEDVGDYLRKTPLAVYPAKWVRQANEPVYDPKHLDEKRLFTSVLDVTYRKWRS